MRSSPPKAPFRPLLGNSCFREREFFIDNLQVRINSIIVMVKWTGLAPWGFEYPFPGSLTSTFLVAAANPQTSDPECAPSRHPRFAWDVEPVLSLNHFYGVLRFHPSGYKTFPPSGLRIDLVNDPEVNNPYPNYGLNFFMFLQSLSNNLVAPTNNDEICWTPTRYQILMCCRATC